jgi:uncharacterized protein with HEPN domain
MTKRNPIIPYQHMLDHAREAVVLTQDKIRADLDTDRLLNLALVRLLEIIGEAANRVPQTEQAHYPQIPWAQMMRPRSKAIMPRNSRPQRLRKPKSWCSRPMARGYRWC